MGEAGRPSSHREGWTGGMRLRRFVYATRGFYLLGAQVLLVWLK